MVMNGNVVATYASFDACLEARQRTLDAAEPTSNPDGSVTFPPAVGKMDCLAR